ncbi:alpha/beta fold hydrolase [Alcaligenaceae bacterium]|nr:alpha/beta fold hydrolase [Alcaligenaceae bacterium]
MAIIEVDGATVSYQIDGEGPDLVLVAGTGGNLNSNWDHLIPALAANHRVLRVDYAGSSGATHDPVQELTVERLAGQVMGAVRAAGVERFDLAGYSLGTAISMYIAAEHPAQVRSLTLLAGFSSGRDTRFALQSALWLDLIEHDPRSFAGLIVLTGLSPEVVSAFSEEEVKAWIDAICDNNDWDGIRRQISLDGRLDITAMLPKIQAPTLSIGCTHDHLVPPHHARALASAIAGARYEELPSGHLAPFEQAEAFAALLLGFIGKKTDSAHRDSIAAS